MQLKVRIDNMLGKGKAKGRKKELDEETLAELR
jgi:hypothetical protein